MTTAVAEPAQAGTASPQLGRLLAMAMFVLVVDTSLMNVSISAVVQDLGTTVSAARSAIALEALVSAAFIRETRTRPAVVKTAGRIGNP